MFQIGNVRGIIKYVLICALTLSSECQAAVNKVQSWGDDDKIYIFTTRRPIWDWWTNEPKFPTYSPPISFYETGERTLFVVILFIAIAVISTIVFLCKRHWKDERQVVSRVSGATVHPPPTISGATTSAYPTTTHAHHSGNSRPLLAFSNMGYQNGSSAVDVPPDYATVAIADLSEAHKCNFPNVVPKVDSPPPKYEEGYTFP